MFFDLLQRATFNIKNWGRLINAMDAVLLADGTRRRVMPFGRRLEENAKKGNQFWGDWLFDELLLRHRTVRLSW